jgi:hypothetical protein
VIRGAARVARAWRALASEQRLAAAAALGLLVTMVLPWYVETEVASSHGQVKPLPSHDLTAFGSFTFVEAAVLLVAASILVLLFARGERKAFHLPGGDGPVIILAGAWAGVLIFYRMLDTPSKGQAGPTLVTNVGLKWGIFFALAAAVALVVAGVRVRAAHRPEPPLPVGGPADPGRVPVLAADGGHHGARARPGREVTPPLPPLGPATAVTERRPRERHGAREDSASEEPAAREEQLSLDVAPPSTEDRDEPRARSSERRPRQR